MCALFFSADVWKILISKQADPQADTSSQTKTISKSSLVLEKYDFSFLSAFSSEICL